MKLVFAMLADYALALPDGKIIIQGGDFDRLYAPTFPVIHPTLALVVKLVAEPKDHDKRDLTLVVEGKRPDGKEWFQATSPPFSWREPDHLGRPVCNRPATTGCTYRRSVSHSAVARGQRVGFASAVG